MTAGSEVTTRVISVMLTDNFRHHAKRRWLRHALVVINLLVLTGCTPRLGDTEAALALEDIVAGSGHSRLKAQTPRPSRKTLQYEIDGRHYTADIYLSPQGVRAGIVLVPGVVPGGKDDKRLVELAYTLARMNFAVLTPDLKDLRHYRVRRKNVREVADAFRYLVSRPEWAPQGHAGIAGFSYGAGPVLLAALDPAIREQVRFVMTLGGYYDLRSLVTYLTTGYFREDADSRWQYRQPNAYIKWAFTRSNADLLENPGDRALLRDLSDRLSDEDKADVDLSPASLALEGRALYALLVNEDPSRVNALIDRLSPRMRHELEGLDPSAHDVAMIKAQVILLHGRSDTMIPFTESVTLARTLPPGQVSLFLIDGFAHVDVRVERKDIAKMLAAMDALLAQRN